MEADQVSASQGPVRSLPAKIQRLLSEPELELREGEKHRILVLKDHLQQLIKDYLLEPSEVEYPALTARCWAEEVRELSYDIDDFLDELVHANAVHKKVRGRIARFRQSRSRSRWFSDEISRFVAQLKEAFNRYKSYSLNRYTKRPATIVQQSPLPPLYGMEAAGLVGITSSLNELKGWLTDEGERRLRVVSIVGFAGVGKTTLAKELYCRIGRQFKCRAFVRPSRKLDKRKLLTSILMQVRRRQPPDASESCNLASTIRAHLQDKKYFIIIDDLWASSTWDIILEALPDDNRFSRILTTTEVEVVAHRCCGHNSKYIFKMEPLSHEEASELFSSRFDHNQHDTPRPLIDDSSKNIYIQEKIQSEIVSQCGGFPMATIVLASLLARQPDDMDQWHYIWSSLNSNLKTNPNAEGMKQIVSLCYNNLPVHLKTCMLYCSLYPEDDIIRKDDLVNMWITEGFICVEEEKDVKKVAYTYFDELVNMGMIQPERTNHNGEVLSCTLHYIILELIQYKSIEENFITVIHHSETNLRLGDKVRRLSLHFEDAEDAKTPEKLRLSQIRSLFYSGPFKSLPSAVVFRLLQFLILHLWADQDNIKFDLMTISKLFRLRHFSLVCNVTLNLQGQLQGLQYLETLKIDSRVISEVPQGIVHLPRLMHLSLPGDTTLPNEIGWMASLETLGYFDLRSNSAANVLSLGKLTRLQDLHLTCSTIPCDNLEEKVGCLASGLSKLSNLKSLAIVPTDASSNANTHEASASSNNISYDSLSNVSSPPALLQKLKLSPRICIFSRLPRWIGDLGNLSILEIAARELSQVDIGILKKLDALAALSLCVRTAPAERIIFDEEGFKVLRKLKFICSSLCPVFMKGAMPKVRTLKLGFSASTLQQCNPVDAGFENLKGCAVFSAKIKYVCFDESDQKAVHSALQHTFGKHTIINVQLVDMIFCEDKEMSSQTTGKADVVRKEGSDEQYKIEGRHDNRRITVPRGSPSQFPTSYTVDMICMNAGLNKSANKQATKMESAMVSISTGAMNSLLRKLETLTGEYEELKGELQAMSALLRQLSNTADPNMKKLRNQITELTYDIEDSIDYRTVPFVINKKGSGSPQERHMLHDFIDQIRNLKALVQEADKQSMTLNAEMHTFIQSYVAREQWLEKVSDDEGIARVGMDGPRDELVERLIGSTEDKLQGLCIVGETGIGKTTLAKQVYNEIKRQFDSYVFISAPKKVDSCYSNINFMDWLCTVILTQLRGTNDIQNTDSFDLISEVRKDLQEKRYLIVVDDVSFAEILDDIKVALPDNSLGSWIIITTTSSGDVVVSCDKYFSSFVYPMMPLTFKESLGLFRSIISGSARSCPVALVKDHEAIVEACGGVPLAITVIAGALSSKPAEMERRWLEFGKSMQGMKHQSVEWIWEILKIGYSDLSCDMKTCLLYLSAFPENHVIRKDRLIRRWVAEGFITKISEETLLETGESYFLELVARKLIEPVYDDAENELPIGCKVSCLIHEFITSLSSQENFVKSVVTDERSMQHDVFRRASVELVSDNKKKSLGAVSLKVRSLTFVGEFGFGWIPDLSIFKYLRVLDLEGTKGFTKKHLEGIGSLPLLIYLGLAGTDVTELPPKTMALEQMTTLDIRRTNVRRLPKFTETKLVSLLADKLTIIPREIKGMQNLEELSKVHLGPDGTLVKELAEHVNKLGLLRMLGITFSRFHGENGTDRQEVKHLLEEVGKSNMQSLLLETYFHGLLDLLNDSWAHNLRRFELRIRGRLQQVPQQEIFSPITLTHLHIEVSEVEARGVRALGNLPKLALLKLSSDKTPRLTMSSKDGFPCLKVFWYDCRYGDGIGLRFEAGSMQQLQRLRLTMFKYGDDFDFGIQHLSSLVQVTIEYKDYLTALEVEAAEEHIRGQVSQNLNNPVLELPEDPILGLDRKNRGRLTLHQWQDSTAKTVIEIHNQAQWRTQISEADSTDKLLVIYFTTDWCPASRKIAPVFAHLSSTFQDVIFLKVDFDKMESIVEEFSVDAVPTFLFIRRGNEMNRVVGAYNEELKTVFMSCYKKAALS